MADKKELLTGYCLCGGVGYECGPPVSAATFCHCESCRRAAGAHVVAWMTVRRDGFAFRQGAPRQFASSPAVVRTFCLQCGTSLTYLHKDSPDTIDIAVATLEKPGEIVPVDHIWMKDALAWDHPADGLPQYSTTRKKGQS